MQSSSSTSSSIWQAILPGRSSRASRESAPPPPPPPRLSFDRIDTAEEASLLPMFEPGLVSLMRSRAASRIDIEGTIEAPGLSIPLKAQIRNRREGLSVDGEVVGNVGTEAINMSYSGADGTVRLRGRIGQNRVDVSHSRTAVAGTTYAAGMVGGVAVDVFLNGVKHLSMRGSMGLDPCLVRVSQSNGDDTRRFSGRVGATEMEGTLEKVSDHEYRLTQVRGDIKLTETIRFSDSV